MGRLIPAGTGFEWYRHVRIPPDEPPPPPQPTEEDLDLDRDIEYAFETEEPMSARPPAGISSSRASLFPCLSCTGGWSVFIGHWPQRLRDVEPRSLIRSAPPRAGTM